MTMNGKSARFLIGAWLLLGQFPSPSEWTRADLETVRLAPARFAALPLAVRNELDRRGCAVPQPFTAKADQPENAIRGHFISPEATDWAVLCSRQRRSSILVFRGGVSKIDELAAEEDAAGLQVTGPGEIGYSRGISIASPRYIREHNRDPEHPLPVLNHDGIDDAFIEKASVVWYWSVNQWLKLAGADAPTLRSEMLTDLTRR
jgi:hypothetical protein